jgi:hypothetical protein
MKKLITKKSFLCVLIMTQILMLQAQNTKLPVGAIPGEVDVSPMGAATYTIPIEVVPGTQGMQPNLSIVYNSMSGFGLLGMKWDLAGLSRITRTGKVRYFDYSDQPGGITFSGGPFLLDGKRLILLWDTNDTYATEEENYMRVYSIKQQGSLSHFIAYTDDGSVIEYGKTGNSKQFMADNSGDVLSWYINKITDANGNYMTFTYASNQDGEMLIQTILYTMNDAVKLKNYASVNFGYKDIPSDLGRNTYFIDGRNKNQLKILDYITVYYGKDDVGVIKPNRGDPIRVRKYQFNYMHEYSNELPQRTVHLKEVLLFGGEIDNNNEKLNATTIDWGDQEYKPSFSDDLVNTDTAPLQNGYILPGDFNGDGYTDYVVYAQTNLKDKWTLYTYSPEDNSFRKSKSGSHSKDAVVFKVNLDGTGSVQLSFIESFSTAPNIFFFNNSGRRDSLGSNYKKYFLGDFSGNGKTDIIFMTDSSYCSFISYIDRVKSYKHFPENIKCKARVGDFHGRGTSMLEVILHTGEIGIYGWNGGGFSYSYRMGYPSDYFNARYSGDFNGDGITDLLTFDGNNFFVSFGKGNGTYTNSTPITDGDLNNQSVANHSLGWHVPLSPIMIADLDGDGIDDIIQLIGTSVIILYSKGCLKTGSSYSYRYSKSGGQFVSYSSQPENVTIADIFNDGFLNVVAKDHTSSPKILQLHKNKQYD